MVKAGCENAEPDIKMVVSDKKNTSNELCAGRLHFEVSFPSLLSSFVIVFDADEKVGVSIQRGGFLHWFGCEVFVLTPTVLTAVDEKEWSLLN